MVRLKIKILKKKTSKDLKRRQEEIFQSLQILVFIFNYYEAKKKKDCNKRGKCIHQKNRQPVPRGKEKNSPGLGTQLAFVFEM